MIDQNLVDRIRQRAYDIWVAEGCREGAADNNWLAAEREILNSAMAAVVASQPQTAKKAKRPAAARTRNALGLAG
jgi:hypothetical protein